MPSLRSSPWIRTQPQRGFSRASLRMSARTAGIDRGLAKAARPAVRPLPPHELAVPAEERCRGDEEGDPSIPSDHPTGRREEDPVDGLEMRSARRPLQHPELVAKDQDLEVLGSVVMATPAGADEEGDEGADEQVDERPLSRSYRADLSANRGFRPPRPSKERRRRDEEGDPGPSHARLGHACPCR